MTRAPTFTHCALLAMAALAACSDTPAIQPSPGIATVVLISIDTLRADFLGVYGHSYAETPHIDAFARKSVRFEQAYAVVPTTLASHASMMTGTFPRTHGVPRNGYRVPDSNLMLAEILGAHGYRSVGFTGGYPLHDRFGFAQGFDEYEVLFGPKRNANDTGARLTDRVLEWAAQGKGAERVFLFVHYWDVHAPYSPPGRFNRMYRRDRLDLAGTPAEVKRLREDLLQDEAGAELRSDAMRRLYAGEVSWTDAQVGRLLEGLNAEGVLEDALVILTSDHGESMDRHPREFWDHGGSLYNEATHIPLIVKLPASHGAGSVVGATVSNVDILPTLLELLGVPIPEGVEGTSLAGHLAEGTRQPDERPVYAEASKPHRDELQVAGAWTNASNCRAIWSSGWKLHQCPRDGHEALYDRARDPDERSNLLPTSDPELLRVRNRLAALLRSWSAGVPARQARKTADPTVVDQLRALGYVE